MATAAEPSVSPPLVDTSAYGLDEIDSETIDRLTGTSADAKQTLVFVKSVKIAHGARSAPPGQGGDGSATETESEADADARVADGGPGRTWGEFLRIVLRRIFLWFVLPVVLSLVIGCYGHGCEATAAQWHEHPFKSFGTGLLWTTLFMFVVGIFIDFSRGTLWGMLRHRRLLLGVLWFATGPHAIAYARKLSYFATQLWAYGVVDRTHVFYERQFDMTQLEPTSMASLLLVWYQHQAGLPANPFDVYTVGLALDVPNWRYGLHWFAIGHGLYLLYVVMRYILRTRFPQYARALGFAVPAVSHRQHVTPASVETAVVERKRLAPARRRRLVTGK